MHMEPRGLVVGCVDVIVLSSSVRLQSFALFSVHIDGFFRFGVLGYAHFIVIILVLVVLYLKIFICF